MKTVEELGISQMPWNIENEEYPAEYGGGIVRCSIKSKDDMYVDKYMNIRDARLIASAPELYVCLCDAVTDFCKDCTHKTNCNDFFIPCPAKRWRRALAKASGEEVDHA